MNVGTENKRVPLLPGRLLWLAAWAAELAASPITTRQTSPVQDLFMLQELTRGGRTRPNGTGAKVRRPLWERQRFEGSSRHMRSMEKHQK